MSLTQILQSDCVKIPLQSSNKKEVIFELVDLLAAKTHLRDADELKEAVWQREQARTTGIGHGVAVPHGKVAGCNQLIMAVGKPTTPIDFEAIDGQWADLIFLLASPIDQTGPHIQALADISHMLTNESFRSTIQHATTADHLYQLISDHEKQHPT